MAKKNELVKAEEYQMASKADTVAEIIQYNTGGRPIQATDLDQIRIPSGGKILWEVPDLGNVSLQEEVVGIIIHWREERAYWKKDIDEGGSGEQPDCTSKDMVTGMGKPGGDCSKCPFAVFGSDKHETGQACVARRFLYLVRGDDTLPIIVNLSPGSLGAIHKYFLSLASKALKPYHVETRLKLVAAKSKKNQAYAKLEASAVRRLDADTLKAVEAYVASIKGSLQAVDQGRDETVTPVEEGDPAK